MYKLKEPKKKGSRKYLKHKMKFLFRSLWNFREKRFLERTIEKHSFQEFFDRNPRISYLFLYKAYCNLAFSREEKFACFEQDLAEINKFLARAKIQNYLLDKILLFSFDDEVKLYLSHNAGEGDEGISALYLYKGALALYSLNFSLGIKDYFTIITLQGQVVQNEDAIREMTKFLHGVFPSLFMLECAKMLSSVMKRSLCLGILNKYQLSHYKKGKKLKIRDYEELYKQSNNKDFEIVDEYYAKLESNKKSLQEIPSKKRSMYKKRYKMYENIFIAFKENLNYEEV